MIYVAELSYRKNQDLLIRSLAGVRKDIPRINLLLVGSGPLLRKYRKEVQLLDLKDSIEFLGYRNDLEKLYTILDIAVSSSRQEGVPVNVMLGMAHGLPAIVTNCRGNSDLIKK